MTTSQGQTGQSCLQITTVVHDAKRDARQRRGQQSWIMLKFMVLVTFALMSYSFYVFTHKICVPIFLQASGALGSLRAAIATLAVFSLLWLWMMWAYVRLVTTSPGKAKKFVKPSAPPAPSAVSPYNYYPLDTTSPATAAPFGSDPARTTIGGPSYEQIRASQEGFHPAQPQHSAHPTDVLHIAQPDHSAGRTDYTQYSIAHPQPPHDARPSYHTRTVSQQLHTMHNDPPTPNTPGPPHMTLTTLKRNRINAKITLQNQLSRIPSTLPVLVPERRYCHKCSIVKPYRTHHCRICGTCILKFDHHCPWIGQCVGAQNHKFFIIFTFAASIFNLYTIITLLSFNLTAQTQGTRFAGDWDLQVIILVALSALFFLFTTSLTFSHVYLTLRGQSTLDGVIASNFREGENEKLAEAYGCLDMRAKREKRAEWDKEWGRIQYEGNIWWLGNKRKEWESVMGTNPIGWIFPIGKPAADGLSYPVNPRFDREGRWRPRSQWPQDLQGKAN